MSTNKSPLNTPKNPAHRREWIKYQLALAGSGIAAIARELGVYRLTPQKALSRPYPRMERAIADKIGVRPEQIWPERYDAQGNSNRPMGRRPTKLPRRTERRTNAPERRNHITPDRRCNVQDRRTD